MRAVELREAIAGVGRDLGPRGVAVAPDGKGAEDVVLIGIGDGPEDDLRAGRRDDLAIQQRGFAFGVLVFRAGRDELAQRRVGRRRLFHGGDEAKVG